jgi:hypothetical protein
MWILETGELQTDTVFQKKQRPTLVWEMSVHLRIAVSLS